MYVVDLKNKIKIIFEKTMLRKKVTSWVKIWSKQLVWTSPKYVFRTKYENKSY